MCFALLIILISFISAIRINEIEINPEGGKQGKEWVEIYNEDYDKDISVWMIYDGLASEKKRYTFPSNTILEEDEYIIVEFNGAVMNNGGDYVILFDNNGEEIDKTKELKEVTASSKTWQFCRGNWEFIEETKDKKNDCGDDENLEKNNKTQETSIIEEKTEINTLKAETELISPEIIKLNAQTIKTTNDTKSSNKNTYTIFGLIGFCALLVFLFLLKRKNKNEF